MITSYQIADLYSRPKQFCLMKNPSNNINSIHVSQKIKSTKQAQITE